MFNISFSKLWTAFQIQSADFAQSSGVSATDFGDDDQPDICDAAWQAAAGSILEDISMVNTANVVPAPLRQIGTEVVTGSAEEGVKLANVYQTALVAYDQRQFVVGRSKFQTKSLPKRRHAALGLCISLEAHEGK